MEIKCDLQNNLSENSKQIRKVCANLILTKEQTSELERVFLSELKCGLSKVTHKDSTIKSYITYVQDLPTGQEQGKSLALDLGGTHFRVLLIQLKGKDEFNMKSKICAVPQHIMTGPGTQLFDYIAECLAEFMKDMKVDKEELPLGFTFSFPLQQLGLTKGLLVKWAKEFNCSGVIGKDVVQLLKDAIAKRGDIKIKICAILNDTIGTLMSCARKSQNCKVGLIVGTGFNICYVERVENAELFDVPNNTNPNIVINTECGAFGENGKIDFIRTEFDHQLDIESINPGSQVYEKMIAGLYMGELVRIILVKLTKLKLLFNGIGSNKLFQKGQFLTKHVSQIESDKRGIYDNCRNILEYLNLPHVTDEDCANVRYICELVSTRSASLVSIAVAVLINKMNYTNVTVAVDGSVYRLHPRYHDLMMVKLRELVKPHIEFDLLLSQDGSGQGAAVVAAVASRESIKKC